MKYRTEPVTEETTSSVFIQRAFYIVASILLTIGIGGPLVMRLLELLGI